MTSRRASGIKRVWRSTKWKAVTGWGIVLLSISAIFSLTSTVITVYNVIIKSEARVVQSVADLDSAYQRRYALVENLVTIVKETKAFEQYQIEIEKELYPKVAEAKASATRLTLDAPQEVIRRIASETKLNNLLVQALEKLFVLAQHYPTIPDPTLKDRTATFAALERLQTSLQELERDIQYSRKELNNAVRMYNQNIHIFPANLLAPQWGFTTLTGFEVLDAQAREDVRIAF